MKKLLTILIIISFLTVSACVKPEDNLSEEDHDKTAVTEKEQKEEAVKNEDETIVFIADTPVCTTCNPYIFKDKRIILNNGELIVNGIENINSAESTVNCFVYTIHNRMIFTDSGVYEFPDQPQYTELSFTESGMTEVPAEHHLTETLNKINETDKIMHASPQILYGDTLDRPGIYVFTESGKCSFVDKNGIVVDLPNVLSVIDENGHTVILYKDGTVKDNYFDETDSWTDICFIDTNRTDGTGITVGVKKDGKPVIAGEYSGNRAEVEEWTDIAYAIVFNNTEYYYPIALTRSGTILIPSDSNCEFANTVSTWKDIVAIGLTAPDGELWAMNSDGEILFAK
ncbi:MAG: hypothetical protein IJB44_06225 [Clostridia bacterium]|nr:hypothetical protein [Clostridia bacterium]